MATTIHTPTQEDEVHKEIPTRDGVEVYTSDRGFVCITQEEPWSDLDDPIIAVHPSLVPKLIELLNEAYEEARQNPPQEIKDIAAEKRAEWEAEQAKKKAAAEAAAAREKAAAEEAAKSPPKKKPATAAT